MLGAICGSAQSMDPQIARAEIHGCLRNLWILRLQGVIQVLRNARGGGWVYVQALRSVTRGWGGLRQRYVTSFFLANTDADFKIVWLPFPMFLCIMLTTKTCSHINNYP